MEPNELSTTNEKFILSAFVMTAAHTSVARNRYVNTYV